MHRPRHYLQPLLAPSGVALVGATERAGALGDIVWRSLAAAPIKGAGRKGRGDSGSEANLHKRVDSERIAEHIAAFEKSGGRVEKLGVTKVLQRVTELAASASAQASKTGGRRR